MPSPLLPPEIKLSRFSNALNLSFILVTETFVHAVLSFEAHDYPYSLSYISNQTYMGWFWADAAAPARPVRPQPTSRSDASPPVCYSHVISYELVLTPSSLVALCTMPLRPPRQLFSRHRSLPQQMHHHVQSLHLTFPLGPSLNPPRLSLD